MSRTTRYGAWFAGVVVAAGTLVAGPAQAMVGSPAGDGEKPFVAKIDIAKGEGSCSGALIEAQWVATAASCFAGDPAQLAAGAPSRPAKVTVGRTDLSSASGQVRDIVELVPRADRDLVLAKLSSPVTGIAPVALSAKAPVDGEKLAIAGYGRTKDRWVPGRMHVGAFTVTGTRGAQLDIEGQDGAAVCKGDAGGPAVRAGAGGDELVAVSSRSWQGGCLGSEETRRGAVEARVDDITDWIGAHVARWSLKAHANDKYVAAELNAAGEQEGRLRARSDKAQGWEQFTLHTRDGGKTVSLRSVGNGLFVSAEINQAGKYEGMLRARAERPSTWESFTMVSQGGRNYALKSVRNGKFVSTEAKYTGADTGLLRARSDKASTWERFTLQHADNFRVAGSAPAGPVPLPLG
ncbi:trypsin-like serine protease [Streptomyces sp. HNM0663]|uniref:Trypsin-like serine protease n=1 Tax=Streptomyces chengmaiensis TaxID=3040919 RepID=A0ABT6HGA1_9ACTN|nr:trypsin-like serine protease [Streptomyces chengmaiensis]MDH2387605.1 trypsin-like serine protease [Streptomyces chengmaiensis]